MGKNYVHPRGGRLGVLYANETLCMTYLSLGLFEGRDKFRNLGWKEGGGRGVLKG